MLIEWLDGVLRDDDEDKEVGEFELLVDDVEGGDDFKGALPIEGAVGVLGTVVVEFEEVEVVEVLVGWVNVESSFFDDEVRNENVPDDGFCLKKLICNSYIDLLNIFYNCCASFIW